MFTDPCFCVCGFAIISQRGPRDDGDEPDDRARDRDRDGGGDRKRSRSEMDARGILNGVRAEKQVGVHDMCEGCLFSWLTFVFSSLRLVVRSYLFVAGLVGERQQWRWRKWQQWRWQRRAGRAHRAVARRRRGLRHHQAQRPTVAANTQHNSRHKCNSSSCGDGS